MAFPTVVQTAQNNNGTGLSSIDMTFTAAPTAGNLMLAAIAVRGGTGVVIVPPTGWDLIRRIDNGTTLALALYSRVNQSGAVSTYTWSFQTSAGAASTQKASGGIREVSGQHPTTPVLLENGGTNASNTSYTTVALSPATGQDYLVFASFATSTGTTATPATNWSEGYDQASQGGNASTRTTSQGQSRQWSGGSISGSTTWGAAAVGVSHIMVIQPAPPPVDLVTSDTGIITSLEESSISTEYFIEVAVADAVSLGSTEQFDNVLMEVYHTLTDSSTLSVIEDATLLRTEHYLDFADSSTITVEELSDIPTPATQSYLELTEGVNLGDFVLGQDPLGTVVLIGATEGFDTQSVGSPVEASDASTLTVVETAAAVSDQSLTDTHHFVAAEAWETFITPDAWLDATPITTTDTIDTFADTNRSESVTIGSTEAADIFIDLAVGDAATLSVTESYTESVNSTGDIADANTILASEDFVIVAMMDTLTDAGAVVSTTSLDIFGDESLTDLSNMTVIENRTMSGTLEFSEETTLTPLEDAEHFGTLVGADNGTLDSSSILDLSTIVNLDELTLFTSTESMLPESLVDLLEEISLNYAEAIDIFADVVYVPTQQIGGLIRFILSVDEISLARTTPDFQIGIAPVSLPEALTATRTTIDDYVSINRSVAPGPTVDRTQPSDGASIYRSETNDDIAATRTAPDAEYGITRTYKGEL